MRVRAAAGAALLPLILAARGGGPGGTEIGLVSGSADFAPGPVRYSFLMLDGRGKPIERPTARIWIARARDAAPFLRTAARLESIEVPSGSSSAGGETN